MPTNPLSAAQDADAAAPDTERAWRVWDLIAANPDHLYMGSWATAGEAGSFPIGLTELTAEVQPFLCGATACAAGWTIAEAGYLLDSTGKVFAPDGRIVARGVAVAELGEPGDMAAELLRIPPDVAERLFLSTEDDLYEAWVDVFGPQPGTAA
jgi:hypothetical protein